MSLEDLDKEIVKVDAEILRLIEKRNLMVVISNKKYSTLRREQRTRR